MKNSKKTTIAFFCFLICAINVNAQETSLKSSENKNPKRLENIDLSGKSKLIDGFIKIEFSEKILAYTKDMSYKVYLTPQKTWSGLYVKDLYD